MNKLSIKKYAHQTLKKVYGLNHQTIKKIIGILALKPNAMGSNLIKKNLFNQTNEIFNSLRIEFRLRLIIFSRIVLLIYTRTYRGLRHMQGLPSRGQRTHANAKTPKRLKSLGKNFPFKFKRKIVLERSKKIVKQNIKQKKKVKLSVKQKGKLKAKQKILKKKAKNKS